MSRRPAAETTATRCRTHGCAHDGLDDERVAVRRSAGTAVAGPAPAPLPTSDVPGLVTEPDVSAMAVAAVASPQPVLRASSAERFPAQAAAAQHLGRPAPPAGRCSSGSTSTAARWRTTSGRARKPRTCGHTFWRAAGATTTSSSSPTATRPAPTSSTGSPGWPSAPTSTRAVCSATDRHCVHPGRARGAFRRRAHVPPVASQAWQMEAVAFERSMFDVLGTR